MWLRALPLPVKELPDGGLPKSCSAIGLPDWGLTKSCSAKRLGEAVQPTRLYTQFRSLNLKLFP